MTRSNQPARILISAQSHVGGIAEHAHHQAQELARRGCTVVLVCRPDHLDRPVRPLYRRVPHLWRSRGTGLVRRITGVAAVAVNHWIIAWHALRLRPDAVLMDCAAEYFAPLWAWPHILLRRLGQTYVANLHDPVRVRLFGPEWLHRWSLRLMYAMLDGGLVHGPLAPEARLPGRLALRTAPLGPFAELDAQDAPVDLRQRLGIPAAAPLLLAFGHVADRKNLDLVIAALALVSGVHLLVAGTTNRSADRQVADYRRQAEAAGLSDRVHFDERFIPDAEIGSYFTTSDIVALTYTGEFVSQSGVLQNAAAFRRPVLVSCGPGPLRDTMERFALGELVEPDSVEAIAAGLIRMLGHPVDRAAAFAAYAQTATWQANVAELLALVDDLRAVPRAARGSGAT